MRAVAAVARPGVPGETMQIQMMLGGLLVAILANAVVVAGAAAADTGAGKALYGPCVTCHGAGGEGRLALNAPALAGQDAEYLSRQIRHFQNGVRGSDPRDVLGGQMRGMAATVSGEEAIANVVAYIGTLPVPETDPVEHDVRNGEVQYNAACGACHGPTAAGNSALNSPNLAILDEAYLRRQYRNFGEGIRGAHPDDKYGRQMQMMASMLATEKDLDDVIGFILAQ
jgi:cytochrome c553